MREELSKKVVTLRDERNERLREIGGENRLVKQIIDLALLTNGMLKGKSLTDFILKEKTEEAKRLLRYSDKSFTAIGSYLGFSSASHFSRVFKACVGSTRSEYRDKYL